jgi:hypothetical protein
MNYNQLSLEQAPGIATPLRFFLTAPLFAIIASLVLLFTGPEIFQDRWLPQTLAFTHLITLGFVTMVMLGALLQLLPVLAGANIPAASKLSAIIHVLYSFGITLLALGLGTSSPQLIQFSMFTLLPGLVIYLLAVSYALFHAQSKHASVKTMRIAVASLWVTISLGFMLALGHGWESIPLLRQFTSLHIAWATVGWICMMMVSVAFQVIPMFQVTNEYPKIISRYLSPIIFLSLLSWSLINYFFIDLQGIAQWLYFAVIYTICLLLAIFIIVTIRLQLQRKKRLADITLYFWFTGLISLFISLLLFFYAEVTHQDFSILVAVIFFGGFIISVINGMLYKIVPFLVWLHLHKQLSLSGKGLASIPTMNEVISSKKTHRQYYLHIFAVILTILSIFLPEVFFYPAAIVWLINWCMLWIHLFQAILLYGSCLESK